MNYSGLRFPHDRSKRLRDFSTDFTGAYKNKKEAKEDLKEGVKKLAELQHKLYAHDKYSLLLIFQAMDAAGKDGTIRHVMSGVNPQGCQVKSFKTPSSEELDHDYLWRCVKALPEKGNIGIFNRSYYEEVLVIRVHPNYLAAQKLPGFTPNTIPDDNFWLTRYRDINNFEKFLFNNHVHILKFFLHVSKEEQKNRFLDRINRPEKNWKFSMGDIHERALWDDYQHAYEQVLLHTSSQEAPWHVIPADHKWFMRTAVSNIIVDKLESLSLSYPKVSEKHKQELAEAKEILEKE